MKLIKGIKKSIEYIEMRVRHQLSHWPVFYAFIGSIGIVLIWRGVDIIAGDLNMSGWLSLLLGVSISIFSGLFVSFFVGDNIIVSGIKKQKRTDEKTEDEIIEEENTLVEIKKDLSEIKYEIEDIEKLEKK